MGYVETVNVVIAPAVQGRSSLQLPLLYHPASIVRHDHIVVELVDSGHVRYEEVCKVANSVYEEVLGFKLLSCSPRLVTLFCGKEVLGSGGIYYGSDKPELVVEQFSRSNRPAVLSYLHSHGINPDEPGQRRLFAEVTGFNVVEAYRRELVKPLLGFIFLYLYQRGIPATLNIQAGTLSRSLQQIGSRPVVFCDADLSHYTGSGEEKRLIQAGYIDRLRPRCVGINTQDIALCFNSLHRPLSQLVLGEHLNAIVR